MAKVLRRLDGPVRIDSRKLAPKSPPWSLTWRTLRGGRQEGVALVAIESDALALTVSPTRGMSIVDGRAGDVRLGWGSPVKEIVHPSTIDLGRRGGLGWLEGFNEWLVRCGLESAGAPDRDVLTNNQGERIETELTLHGRIANLPASEVELVCERAPPFAVRLRGRVDERQMFGPQLELWTEIAFVPGRSGFRVTDTVTNRGGAPQELQLIYHVNFGPPLLGDGARLHAPLARVTPINARAAAAIDGYAHLGGPVAGFVEEVFCLAPKAGDDGRTRVALVNPAGDRAAVMSYGLAELPCLTLWKQTGALADGYVVGIEPGTSFPRPRRIERERGHVPVLAPGASRTFAVEYAFPKNRRQVAAALAAIARLQGAAPRVDRAPNA